MSKDASDARNLTFEIYPDRDLQSDPIVFTQSTQERAEERRYERKRRVSLQRPSVPKAKLGFVNVEPAAAKAARFNRISNLLQRSTNLFEAADARGVSKKSSQWFRARRSGKTYAQFLQENLQSRGATEKMFYNTVTNARNNAVRIDASSQITPVSSSVEAPDEPMVEVRHAARVIDRRGLVSLPLRIGNVAPPPSSGLISTDASSSPFSQTPVSSADSLYAPTTPIDYDSPRPSDSYPPFDDAYANTPDTPTYLLSGDSNAQVLANEFTPVYYEDTPDQAANMPVTSSAEQTGGGMGPTPANNLQ